jgi:predicted secreted protein
MAKAAGRLALLSKNSVALAGVKVVTIKWAAESIDVTDRDSSGIIELLGTVKTQQVTIDVEGVYKDPTLRDIAFDPAVSKLLTDLTFKFSDALTAKDTITGNFFFSSYEEGNPSDDATTFSASFTSSGAWVLG